MPSDAYLEALLAKPHFIAVVALAGTEVVGGLGAYVLEKFGRARSEVYIYDLAVSEAHRRRGVAIGLIRALGRALRNVAPTSCTCTRTRATTRPSSSTNPSGRARTSTTSHPHGRLTSILEHWLLPGPFAVLAAAALGPPANALAATALLSSIAGVHLLWALGAWWPAPSREPLALYVIGRRRLPGPGASLVVTAALVVFASLRRWARTARDHARVVVAALFAARGLFGFFEGRLHPRIAGTPYATYSRYLYSPLSLLIASVAAFS